MSALVQRWKRNVSKLIPSLLYERRYNTYRNTYLSEPGNKDRTDTFLTIKYRPLLSYWTIQQTVWKQLHFGSGRQFAYFQFVESCLQRHQNKIKRKAGGCLTNNNRFWRSFSNKNHKKIYILASFSQRTWNSFLQCSLTHFCVLHKYCIYHSLIIKIEVSARIALCI